MYIYLHEWLILMYIYLHLVKIDGKCIGKYTVRPMDPMDPMTHSQELEILGIPDPL